MELGASSGRLTMMAIISVFVLLLIAAAHVAVGVQNARRRRHRHVPNERIDLFHNDAGDPPA